MKFNKVISEAAAEIVGSGTTEKLKIYIDKKQVESKEIRDKYPAIHKVIMKAVGQAKRHGFNIAPEKSPADITLKANGDVILTADDGSNQKRFNLDSLGLDPNVAEQARKQLQSVA